jgi:hypothetical protein
MFLDKVAATHWKCNKNSEAEQRFAKVLQKRCNTSAPTHFLNGALGSIPEILLSKRNWRTSSPKGTQPPPISGNFTENIFILIGHIRKECAVSETL